MPTGVFMEAHLSTLVLCVLSLFMLIHLSRAAPGQPGKQREELGNIQPPSIALANPFGSGEEERRLLQSYILSSLKESEGGPEINTREQEVFFLFRLYDYDRSGLLDGLEIMKMLFDYNSHHTPGAQANELVVSMVDFLLQTQDLNHDGLLAPSELLSPSLPEVEDSGNNKLQHQDVEVALEEKLSNPGNDQKKAEEAGQEEELHEEIHHQEEVKTEENQPIVQVDDNNGQQVPEALAGEQMHVQKVPVHHGQPEI